MASDESGDGDLAGHLRRAEVHFEQAIELFQSTIQKIRDGEDVPTTEADKVSKALFGAASTLLNFKLRIYDERKRQQGAANGYALDLDDARLKVGRLLDRLRASRGSGTVSE